MRDYLAEFEKQQKKLVLRYIFLAVLRFVLLVIGVYLVQHVVELAK